LHPGVSVRESAKAVEFYKAAFAAVENYRLDVPGGGLVVRLSVGSAEFWVSDGPSDPGNSPESLGGGSVRMILTIANPDEVFDQARKAGAPRGFSRGKEHGWRLGPLADPFGLPWEIGYELAETV
jgi:PhnB protein